MAKDNPSFSSILDRPIKSFDRPKPMPVGTYTCLVKGQPRFDVSSKQGTPFVEFSLQFIEAGEDVDQDDLVSVLTKGSGETVPLRDKSIRVTFYTTEEATYRLEKFLDNCGVDMDDEISGSQAVQDAIGKTVGVKVTHSTGNDGTIYANVTQTFRVGD